MQGFANFYCESLYISTVYCYRAEPYLEPSHTSKMERFAKKVNSWKPLTIFAKRFVWDVWLGSEYTSAELHLSSNYLNDDGFSCKWFITLVHKYDVFCCRVLFNIAFILKSNTLIEILLKLPKIFSSDAI